MIQHQGTLIIRKNFKPSHNKSFTINFVHISHLSPLIKVLLHKGLRKDIPYQVYHTVLNIKNNYRTEDPQRRDFQRGKGKNTAKK